jgi:hypothetical protein
MTSIARPFAVQIVDSEGTVLASEYLVSRDASRPYSSGKFGYNANGKATLRSLTDTSEGIAQVDRFQISFNAVQIARKDGSTE